MKALGEQNFYELLELPVDASTEQVRTAYAHVNERYAPDSLVLYTLADPSQVDELRNRLKEALAVLSEPAQRAAYDRSIGLVGDPAVVAASAELVATPIVETAALEPVKAETVVEVKASESATSENPTVEVTDLAKPAAEATTTVVALAPAPVDVAASEPVAPPESAPPYIEAIEPTPTLVVAAEPLAPVAAELVAPAAMPATPALVETSSPVAPAAVEPAAPVPAPIAAVAIEPVAPPPLSSESLAEKVAAAAAETPMPVVEVAASVDVVTPQTVVEVVPATRTAPVHVAPVVLPEPEPPPIPVPPAAVTVLPPLAPVEEPSSTAARIRVAQPGGPSRPRMPDIGSDTECNGELLRQVREARGLSLQTLADRTRISRSHLENVEADRYSHLPPTVYLRGILTNLARELKLEPTWVCRSYLSLVSVKNPK